MRSSAYLDYAATRPLDPRVLEAMQPFFTEWFGNPSSVHAQGRRARYAVEEARERVAALLAAEPSEIVFTSGGTESNNAALAGVLAHAERRGAGLITSAVEHEAILRPAEAWAREGHPVVVLRPDSSGCISAEAVAEAIDDRTGLVSVMWVNNELGTLNPIGEIAGVCRAAGVPLHSDAVQAAALYGSELGSRGPDLLSLSAHKVGGPKGVGLLLIRAGTPFIPRILGGSQERRRRAGTENVPGIVGLARALELSFARADAERARISGLREGFVRSLKERFAGRVRLNSPGPEASSPHIINVSFRGEDEAALDGEMLLLALDMAGVMVSSGSACASGALEPSHVLEGIGLSHDWAAATVRFSMGPSTTADHLDRALEALGDALARQSPSVTTQQGRAL